jgi:transcriptional regulator with XRE-family HTH domain
MDNAQTPSDRVAARVRALRRDQEMTVAQLAERCAAEGMPQLTAQALYKLETRRAAPSGARRPVTVDELFTLARALGTTAGELLLGSRMGSRTLGPMTPKGLRQLADYMEESGITWGDEPDGQHHETP